MIPAHISGAASVSLNSPWNREDEVTAGNHPVGVAAVPSPAGELCLGAEILQALAAVVAVAACASQPGDADALSVIHAAADHLMSGDDRELASFKVAVEDLQVGATHPAHRHVDGDLANPGDRVRRAADQQFAGPFQHRGPHRNLRRSRCDFSACMSCR